MNEDFYKDQAWKLLTSDIREMKESMKVMQTDIESLKNQRSRMMGIVFGITVIITAAWNYILAKVTHGQ